MQENPFSLKNCFKKWLVNGHLRVNPSSDKQVKEVWSKPEEGWIKINFYKASKGNLGPLGIRFVAWDWQGNILSFGAQRVKDGMNNIAEEMATLNGIHFGKNMGFSKLHLEGDSLIMVNAIILGVCQAWHFKRMIYSIRSELEPVWHYWVGHARWSQKM